jgi:hypothetical protein
MIGIGMPISHRKMPFIVVSFVENSERGFATVRSRGDSRACFVGVRG